MALKKTSSPKGQQIKALQNKVKKLSTELDAVVASNAFIKVRVQKAQAHFKRVRNPEGPDIGIGDFFLLVDVTAVTDTVYIPISIASGKKATGFVYQIEGTAKGAISTTSISCKGKGVTQITLGTIVYAKIPKGMTATFRIVIEIRGKVGNTYGITINLIHYKRNPSDARYEKYTEEVSSKKVEFR